jgi:uncharacterized protein (DUF1800 family)
VAVDPTAERADIAHLLRRAGFGGRADQIDALAAGGYEAAVDALVAPLTAPDADLAADAIVPPTFDTAGYLARRDGTPEERRAAAIQARTERRALMLWAVQRMAAADHPLREKLTFLWHDHFATSVDKVKVAQLLYLQYRTLASLGAGRFDDLVHAVARDPAMLVWLDGRESTATAPNENFARELFELFTLGHQAALDSTTSNDDGDHDHHDGHGGTGQPYTESDVAEAARALTGWVIDPGTGSGVLRPGRFDGGTKTVLGTTGRLGLDEVVATATANPACAPHVVSRLWSRLARPAGPTDATVVELAEGFAADLDVAALLRAAFVHPDFRSRETRTGLVKMPVEYLVGIHRSLGLVPAAGTLVALDGLGQVPFLPPDVSGWPTNEAWLSTASALARLELATTLDPGPALDPVRAAAPGERPAALARLLGVESWGPATTAALEAAADDPRTLLTVALVAPEHVLN